MWLDTGRLGLRPFREADADALQAIAEKEAVAATTAAIPHPYPPNGARAFIAHAIASAHAINRFGIFLQDDGRLIGAIACGKAATPIALAYMIDPPHWGRGYASEAARAVVALCFEERARDVIHSTAMVDNAASLKVLKKLGFVETRRAPLFLPARGREVETSFQELTREAWSAVAGSETTN